MLYNKLSMIRHNCTNEHEKRSLCEPKSSCLYEKLKDSYCYSEPILMLSLYNEIIIKHNLFVLVYLALRHFVYVSLSTGRVSKVSADRSGFTQRASW